VAEHVIVLVTEEVFLPSIDILGVALVLGDGELVVEAGGKFHWFVRSFIDQFVMLEIEDLSWIAWGVPVVRGVPSFWRNVVLDNHIWQQRFRLVVDAEQLVGQPEIDDVRVVDGPEGVDVNVLALVENQLLRDG